VIAAATPGGCFDAALEAARIALKYRTPVFLLSDAYLANGSEPWLVPDVETLPEAERVVAARGALRAAHALLVDEPPPRPADVLRELASAPLGV
jgi:pyruvate/2-oxoacid:ferredoxin oxidoreductase alpha subunit